MSNAESNERYAEERRFFPELPTNEQWSQEMARVSTDGLHLITDKVGDGVLSPDLGRRVLRAYLDTVFGKYNLYGQHSLGDSLRPWLEVIDNHQRRLSRAEQEGRTRLPSINQLLAGAPGQGNRGGAATTGQQAPAPAPQQDAPPQQPTPPGGQGIPGQHGQRPDNDQCGPQPIGGGGDNPDIEEEEDAGGEARTRNCGRRNSSTDDEESEDQSIVVRRSKRPRDDFIDDDDDDTPQDKADFGWAAESFINHAVMSDRHKKILRTIKNYKKNIYSAVESIEQCVHAMVAARHNPIALAGPANAFAEALQFTSLAKPVDTKAVTDMFAWTRAWFATANTIAFAFPSRRSELDAYTLHIQRFFEDYHPTMHGNVLLYDKAVRQLIGTRRDILFDETTHPDVVRFKTIYLDLGGVHYRTSAPGGPSQGPSGSKPRNKSKEVCRKFNRGDCDGCERKHICALCGELGHGANGCGKLKRK
ncbi:hypothetical protein EV361DRAFT_956133 [Lentinula raphanica]|nr:hypothetical protein EV361DRAFT_956133 [Lentinula raphanica]